MQFSALIHTSSGFNIQVQSISMAYTTLGKAEVRQAKLVAEVIRKAGQAVPNDLAALERLPTGNWKTRKSAEWRNRAH